MVRKKNKMFVDSADRTPHYSLRKLSVGVASVLLSTTLWMGANGSVAHADTINDATVVGKGEDKLDPSETHKDQTQAQTAESTSQASVASSEKQNGEAQNGQAQAAVADANQAESKHKKSTAPMLKRKRQLQTMRKLTWKSKNLQLKVSKLLRKLKFQPQRQRKNKLQLLKVKRMVLQMPMQPLT